MQEYADPVIDWLDAGRGILAHRLFRDVSVISQSTVFALTPFVMQSCTQLPNGSYTKDLSMVEQDLSRICLVDNSPISYRINEGLSPFTHSPCRCTGNRRINSERYPHRRLDARSIRRSSAGSITRFGFIAVHQRCSQSSGHPRVFVTFKTDSTSM